MFFFLPVSYGQDICVNEDSLYYVCLIRHQKKDNVNRKLQFIRLVFLHSFIDKRFTFISIVNTKQTEITRNNAS